MISKDEQWQTMMSNGQWQAEMINDSMMRMTNNSSNNDQYWTKISNKNQWWAMISKDEQLQAKMNNDENDKHDEQW